MLKFSKYKIDAHFSLIIHTFLSQFYNKIDNDFFEISADELLDGKEGKATETKLERGAKLIRELLADKKEISIRELKSIVSDKEWQFIRLILFGFTNDEATSKAHVSKNVLGNIREKVRRKTKNKKI